MLKNGYRRVTKFHWYLHRKPRSETRSGGRPKSRHTLTKNNKIISNEQVKEWLCELIAAEGAAYGYVKLTHCLRKKYNLLINKKKVYRLCKELKILRPQRKVKRKHPKKLACNRIVTASNQLWEVDVKYGYIASENRFFFIMPIIDVFDRCIIDYYIGLSVRQEMLREKQLELKPVKV